MRGSERDIEIEIESESERVRDREKEMDLEREICKHKSIHIVKCDSKERQNGKDKANTMLKLGNKKILTHKVSVYCPFTAWFQ